jgi:oligopeptide/dipeptide ABC transporter ATP-binding protein
MSALVEVKDLTGHFKTYGGNLNALQGVNLSIEKGKITGLVGETGSGKSVTASALMKLLPETFEFTGGSIRFDDLDILSLPDHEVRALRGKRISMVFQDSRAALNPVFTVGEQIQRVLRQHSDINRWDASKKVIETLERVQIPEAERRAKQYCHEFSGGMAQRAMIAMALIHSPQLIIMDEPTTGLDVTTQAEIMALIRKLADDSGLTVLLITHDLGVVAETCDMVSVMYAGQVVESGSAEDIFTRASHPYTAELMRASLSVEADASGEFYSIPGSVPDLRQHYTSCLFASRCTYRAARCEEEPEAMAVNQGHLAKCHFPLHAPSFAAPEVRS